jgi:hypothetical protein
VHLHLHLKERRADVIRDEHNNSTSRFRWSGPKKLIQCRFEKPQFRLRFSIGQAFFLTAACVQILLGEAVERPSRSSLLFLLLSLSLLVQSHHHYLLQDGLDQPAWQGHRVAHQLCRRCHRGRPRA